MRGHVAGRWSTGADGLRLLLQESFQKPHQTTTNLLSPDGWETLTNICLTNIALAAEFWISPGRDDRTPG